MYLLCEALKNTIISGGYFIRLLYSTENITLNGIHMNITFNKGNYDINNNKLKLHFNIKHGSIYVLSDRIQKLLTLYE